MSQNSPTKDSKLNKIHEISVPFDNSDQLRALKLKSVQSQTNWRKLLKPSKQIIFDNGYDLLSNDRDVAVKVPPLKFQFDKEYFTIIHRLEDSLRQTESNCLRRINDLSNILNSMKHKKSCMLEGKFQELIKSKRKLLLKIKKSRKLFADFLIQMSNNPIVF